MLTFSAKIFALVVFVATTAFVGIVLWNTLFPPHQADGAALPDKQYAQNKTANQQSEMDGSKIATDEKIANYTLALAVFTAFLVLVSAFQIGFLISAQNTAEKAAGAAQKSADTAQQQFAAGFKPWLLVDVSGPYVDERQFPMTLAPAATQRDITILAEIKITNRADMPATVLSSDVGVVSQTTGLIISAPPEQTELYSILNKGDSFYPLRRVQMRIPQGSPQEEIDILKNVNVGAFQLTDQNKKVFFHARPPIIGKIFYLDALGNKYELGYAFQPNTVWARPDGAGNGFTRWGGQQYNYDRKISE